MESNFDLKEILCNIYNLDELVIGNKENNDFYYREFNIINSELFLLIDHKEEEYFLKFQFRPNKSDLFLLGKKIDDKIKIKHILIPKYKGDENHVRSKMRFN